MVKATGRKQQYGSRRRRTHSERQHGAGGARRLGVTGIVAALLVIHGILAATSIRHKCGTFDEVAHLTRGYTFWHLDDNRLMSNHPPLAHAWAGLPLLDDALRFPSLQQEAWYHSDVFALGKQFFYRMGNDPDAMLRQSRMMMIVLSMGLGGLVFWCSTRLFGTVGGCISLVLYTFSPTVLASARLVTTDMAVSLFFLLSMVALWHFLHRVNYLSWLGCSAALAGLALSKMSAALMLPMAGVLVLLRLIDGRALCIRLGKEHWVTSRWKMTVIFFGSAAVCILTVWFALWAAFDFRYESMIHPEPGRERYFSASPPPEGKTVWEHQARGIPKVAALIDWARKHRLLPEAYLYGFLSTMQGARGRDNFLNGGREKEGWWYFFPLCFLYKVPLAIMGVILLALVGFLVRAKQSANHPEFIQGPWMGRLGHSLYDTAPFWVLLIVYWGFAITSHLNIGHRHLLPAFAPMFILCGASEVWLKASRRWVRAIVPSLLSLLGIASILVWPHYLAYFNWIAGGPANGYRHLVDSSLDWGQDLPGLKRWLTENRTAEDVYVAYFGTGDVRYYGISASFIPYYLRSSGTGDYRLGPGTYCISATRLQQIYLLKSSRWTEALEEEYGRLLPEMREFEDTPDDKEVRAAVLEEKGQTFNSRFKRFQRLRFGRLCASLREREPDDDVGHSILIYHLTEDDVVDALSGPVEGIRPMVVE